MSDVQRDLGGIEARLVEHDRRLSDIEEKLDTLLERTAIARGGFRMLVAVGSIAATVAASITELLHWSHK